MSTGLLEKEEVLELIQEQLRLFGIWPLAKVRQAELLRRVDKLLEREDPFPLLVKRMSVNGGEIEAELVNESFSQFLAIVMHCYFTNTGATNFCCGVVHFPMDGDEAPVRYDFTVQKHGALSMHDKWTEVSQENDQLKARIAELEGKS